MSKDSFKVKKGLTLNPVDPSEIINPEPGDLIADSTDDNKIKRYDATSADWSSVGGSAGIGGNLMPEFEKLTPDLVNVTSVVDTVTFLPIDDNNKSIKATFSGVVGSIQYQVPVDASLHEIQGTVSVWVRTSVQNLQISSVQDDVKVSTLPISATNKWKQYELPTVIGGTEMGFIIESTTGVSGDVFIDQPFVGLTPSSYGFEVAQAEYVGSVTYSASNCLWTGTTTANFTDFGVDADCIPVVDGDVSAPDTRIPAVKIPNAKIGNYSIQVDGFAIPTGGGGTVTISDQSSLTAGVSLLNGSVFQQNGYANKIPNGSFEYTSVADRTIRVLYRMSTAGTMSLYAEKATGYSLKISVYYTPPKSHIVTQNLEKTAQNSNEINVDLAISGSTWSVTNSDFPVISGFTSSSSTFTNVTFLPDIFTVAPLIRCSSRETGNNISEVNARNITALGFSIQGLTFNGGGFNPSPLFCTIKKQGVDFNKSQIVYGTFEQIKTTELCKVEAWNNSTEAITAFTEDINYTVVVKDNCGAWTNSGNTGSNERDSFTAPRDMRVMFSLCVSNSTNPPNPILYNFVNNANGYATFFDNGSGSGTICGTGTRDLLKNDLLTFRVSASVNLVNNANHRVFITEIPDLAGIVKNLNDNKNVKCQTKYLSANYTSGNTNSLSDLLFQNLTLGKRYEATYNVSSVGSIGFIRHNSIQVLQVAVNTSPSATISQSSIKFKAVGGNVEFGVSNNSGGNPLFGDGTTSQTWAELCELPDNYIDTDEW